MRLDQRPRRSLGGGLRARGTGACKADLLLRRPRAGALRGLSLHTGVNRVDPAHYDGWDCALNACEFDANDMETLAKSRGFEGSRLLTDEGRADALRGWIG